MDLDRLEEEKRKDMESRWFWAFGRLVHMSATRCVKLSLLFEVVGACAWGPIWQCIVSSHFLFHSPCVRKPDLFMLGSDPVVSRTVVLEEDC